ncbi:hypothetical protein GCM10010293_16450 [Streptomyces griseoflavus]|nr:hypothetical protein GCM10010293_16450 [Streptomyces griseoflavus]
MGAIAVLCLVFGIVLALGHAVVIRHRAAGGADLAALAAADHWAEGRAAGCARAERVARAQDARLVRCAITGEVADVSVASGNGPFTVEVRARAGPAGPPDPLPPGTAGAPARAWHRTQDRRRPPRPGPAPRPVPGFTPTPASARAAPPPPSRPCRTCPPPPRASPPVRPPAAP